MSDNILLMLKIMNEIKVYVVVTNFPKIKNQKLKYRLPDYIESVPIVRYLIREYNISLDEANFIIDNMQCCKAIQPGDKYIKIGVSDDSTIVIHDIDYGEFRITGKRKIQCHDPKDIDCTLTSYICNRGITVFVHRYKRGSQSVASVYYGDKFDGLSSYMKLSVNKTLYEAYIRASIYDNVFLNEEGEYHETYRRSR